MKYRVKLKTTVTRMVDIEIDTTHPDFLHYTEQDFRELAADDAVAMHAHVLSEPLKDAGLEYGPIELAYENLDESVEVIG